MLLHFLIFQTGCCWRLPRQTSTKYEASRDLLTYEQAEAACEAKNKILAYVPDAESQLELTSYLSSFVLETSLTQAAEPFDFWIGLKRTINNRGEASDWFWKGPGTETCPFSSGPNFYRSPDPPTGVGGGDIQRIATRLKINQLRNPNENWEAHRWDEPQATTGYVCMEKPTEFCGRTLDKNDSNNGSDSNDSTGSTNSPDDATSTALSFLLLATIIF